MLKIDCLLSRKPSTIATESKDNGPEESQSVLSLDIQTALESHTHIVLLFQHLLPWKDSKSSSPAPAQSLRISFSVSPHSKNTEWVIEICQRPWAICFILLMVIILGMGDQTRIRNIYIYILHTQGNSQEDCPPWGVEVCNCKARGQSTDGDPGLPQCYKTQSSNGEQLFYSILKINQDFCLLFPLSPVTQSEAHKWGNGISILVFQDGYSKWLGSLGVGVGLLLSTTMLRLRG